jgi:hypothetical protein
MNHCSSTIRGTSLPCAPPIKLSRCSISGRRPSKLKRRQGTFLLNLADPAGRVHDSIRSYGGGQTPLVQEAYLLELVAALQELHARYIVLRSSNTLDQLFLANFLRRSYPDGRIVILTSDLMFIRERGSTGLSGTMTLSNYPLFPLERDWTEHQSLPSADRTFSSDTSEATYIAFRLLLNDKRLNGGKSDPNRCHVLEDPDEKTIFVPRVSCTLDPPIPDYSPPFWMLKDQCGEANKGNAANIENQGEKCPYPGPATWLSVIGNHRLWPLASLTKETRMCLTSWTGERLSVRMTEKTILVGGQGYRSG